jgi:hypothetical protein
VLALLNSPAEVQQLVDHNYEVGQAHFSYEVLEDRLQTLLY